MAEGHDRRTLIGAVARRFVAIAMAVALLLPQAAFAQSAQDTLRPDDRLRIKIVEWRAGEGRYHEWEVFTGEYLVGGNGQILLPLIGEVHAAGRTTAAISEEIADRLQKRASLINRPEPSVELVQHRPVYVIGEVNRPGQVEYHSGITALQAVAMAGGLYRRAEDGLLRLERDRIAAAGELERARRELRRLLARQARLDAEMEDKAAIEMPAAMNGMPEADRLIDEQRVIFKARNEALQSKENALTELGKLLRTEGESLTRKIGVQQRQVRLANQELEGVGGLVDKGLTVASRRFALERTVADLESRLLDLESASLKVKQDIARTERDILDLRNDRQAQVAAERQENLAAIDQVTVRIDTSAKLMDEATEVAPMLALERWEREAGEPVYSIVRNTDGQAQETRIDEKAALRPGDTLRVRKASAADGTAAGGPPPETRAATR